MSNPTSSPPPNKAPNMAPNRGNRKRTGAGCAAALLLLLAGLVAAGVFLGPGALRLLPIQAVVAPSSPQEQAAMENLAAQRERAAAQLDSYGWLDKDANVVHIPVRQAMTLLADGGLPVGETPTTATTAGEAAASAPPSSAAPAVDLANVSFNDHVLPIFVQHCAECHGDEKSEEGLKLIRYRTVMVGSQNGPVVAPGDLENSYLVEMVTSGKMPKEGEPLTPAEIDVIAAWIMAGALDN